MTFPRRARVHATLRDGRRDWFKIQNNVAAGAADVWIFDEIGFWGVSASELVDQLQSITAPTINVHINSPGGEVFDGLAIYSVLKAHPANIHVMVHGLCASAASFIALAGDQITTARNAMWMIHNAMSVTIGDEDDHLQTVELLRKASVNIADIYQQRAGGTVDEWRARMRAETWYTGAEAVGAGLADQMTDPDPVPADVAPQMRQTWDLSVFRHAPPAAGDTAKPAPVAGEHGPELVIPPGGLTVTFTAAQPADPASSDDGGEPATEPAESLEVAPEPPTGVAPEVDEQEPEPSPEPVDQADDDWPVAALLDQSWVDEINHLLQTSGTDDEFNRLKEALI